MNVKVDLKFKHELVAWCWGFTLPMLLWKLRSVYQVHQPIIKDVKNETSLFSSSLRHVMLQYFGIFQPSSGIMMTVLYSL